MGDSFFNKIKDSTGSIGDLEESILGPEYKYYKFIKSPGELGMSSEGTLEVLGKNIKGIISYTQLLVSGKGDANGSNTGKPLGNKFFMDTGSTCSDVDTSNNVSRSIYVDNVPSGSIPFLTSGTGVQFSEFEGLVPGTLENLTRINPIKIFKTFTNGANPTCRAITMEVINKDSDSSFETKYITDDDISDIPPCSFSEKINPVTKVKCREGFTTSGMSGSFGGNHGNYSSNKRNNSRLYSSYSTPVPPKRSSCIFPKSCMNQNVRNGTLGNETLGSRFITVSNDIYRVIPTEVIMEREIISKSDFPDDIYIKIYFSALGLFGLYLLTKMIVKQGGLRV